MARSPTAHSSRKLRCVSKETSILLICYNSAIISTDFYSFWHTAWGIMKLNGYGKVLPVSPEKCHYHTLWNAKMHIFVIITDIEQWQHSSYSQTFVPLLFCDSQKNGSSKSKICCDLLFQTDLTQQKKIFTRIYKKKW